MIKAVIFDWFGVCTKENWEDCVMRELTAKLDMTIEEIRPKYKKLLQPFSRSELSADEYMRELISSLDKTKDPKDFHYLFDTIPAVNDELLGFIAGLRKNHKVFLLSNSFGPIYPNYEKTVDFKKYFDHLFLSHKLKVSKTQDKIWDIVLSELGDFKPEEIVYVDNKEKYLKFAMRRGVKTILFTSNEQVKKDLASMGAR